MRQKLLVFTAVFTLAFVGTTFAAVENIKVSGDITAQAITRDISLGQELEWALGPSEYEGADSEDFIFSQIRLRFDADLTENVSAVIRVINERLWGDEDNSRDMTGLGFTSTAITTDEDTEIDLDLGYIELKEFLYQPLTVIVGRQNLRYGNALIVGDPDTNQGATAKAPLAMSDLSLRKSFDAVRAILDYSPYTVDVIYAKLDEGYTQVIEDVSLWGINANYQWASYSGITEGYLFAKQNAGWSRYINGVLQPLEKQDYVYVLGGRVQWDPNDHWTIGVEGAYQFGDANRALIGASSPPDKHVQAFAGQVGAQYRFLNDYNSVLGLSYTYLSGEDDPMDGDYEGWDPMFEDQTPAEIMNILGMNTNAHFIQLKGSLMPREDVTLGLLYAHARLAEDYNDFVGAVPGFTTYVNLLGPASYNIYFVERNSKHFGDEIDFWANYDYTEDVQLKLNAAWFMPGSFFDECSNNTSYSVRGSVSVLF
jgi:hypothetical protein